jgi:hypothetical protein
LSCSSRYKQVAEISLNQHQNDWSLRRVQLVVATLYPEIKKLEHVASLQKVLLAFTIQD